MLFPFVARALHLEDKLESYPGDRSTLSGFGVWFLGCFLERDYLLLRRLGENEGTHYHHTRKPVFFYYGYGLDRNRAARPVLGAGWFHHTFAVVNGT